jgi:DNA modification methylase
VAALVPRHAAVVTDPPYRVGSTGFDYTKARRRPSHWPQNYAGLGEVFDPTPWLGFPEVILFGANHYWDQRLAGGSWVYWDKTEGQDPGDFARFEFIWLSTPGPPQYFPWQHRGGMRRGEMNWVHLPKKRHPAEKPVELLTFLVKQTTAPVVIDPFMGSGSTLAACVRLGRPCIGIEIDPGHFATACDRPQDELQQLALCSIP